MKIAIVTQASSNLRGTGVVERYFFLTKKGQVDRILVQMGEMDTDGKFVTILRLIANVNAYFDER